MTIKTPKMPENPNAMTEEQMQALAEHLNDIEPGTGQYHDISVHVAEYPTQDIAEIMINSTLFFLFAAILILMAPAIIHYGRLTIKKIKNFTGMTIVGSIYNRYFS